MTDPAHKADSFQDACGCKCLRPSAHPNRIAWAYFEVEGKPAGTLEVRRFNPCPCGCGNLTADPPVDCHGGPSFGPV